MTLPRNIFKSYSYIVNRIIDLTSDNKSSKYICDLLKIPKYEFYNICKRENIKFTKKYVGKKLGAKDKKKRIRKCKNKN